MGWRNRRNRSRREREDSKVIPFRKGAGAAVEDMVNMPGVGIVPRSVASYPASKGGTHYGTYGGAYTPIPLHKQHKGDPIKVGEYTIYAGAHRDLKAEDMDGMDVIMPLLQDIPPMRFGYPYRIIAAPLVDYGGVPPEWEQFLKEIVIPLLAGGNKILTYCMGSHGRTGCMLASLISILETAEQTPDPIAATRERHCKKAVESLAQAKAIYALRGQELPAEYVKEFEVKYTGYLGGGYAAAGYGYYDDWQTRFDSVAATPTVGGCRRGSAGTVDDHDAMNEDVRTHRDRGHWGY